MDNKDFWKVYYEHLEMVAGLAGTSLLLMFHIVLYLSAWFSTVWPWKISLNHQTYSKYTNLTNLNFLFACYRKWMAGWCRRWRSVRGQARARLWCHWQRRRWGALCGTAEVGLWLWWEDRLPQLSQPAMALHGPVSWEGGTTQPGTEPPAAQVHQVRDILPDGFFSI